MAELEESLAEQTQQAPSEPEKAPETKQNKPPKPPKEKGWLLLPVLTVLLIMLGIGEAAYWSLKGFDSFRISQAQKQYEQQLAALESERQARGITGGSAYGPSLKVENGRVTWRLEDERPSLIGSGTGFTYGTGGEKWLSGLSVPKIQYRLARPPETDAVPTP